MDMKTIGARAVAFLAIASFAAAPITAGAQSRAHHRQQTKNTWRNLAYAGGVATLLGLLKGDSTLTFVGAAGGLYSTYRYEQDRKSQNRIAHARYELFRRKSFDRDGHHYVRKTVTEHGHKYYRFVRAA